MDSLDALCGPTALRRPHFLLKLFLSFSLHLFSFSPFPSLSGPPPPPPPLPLLPFKNKLHAVRTPPVVTASHQTYAAAAISVPHPTYPYLLLLHLLLP